MVLSLWVAAALGATAPASPANPAVNPPDQATTAPGSGDGASVPEATVSPPEATLSEPLAPLTADDDQKPPLPKPGFGGNFILDNSIPSGTFIFNNAYTFNPAVTTNLILRPSYTFTIGNQSLRAEFSQLFSFADVLDQNSTITRRFTWTDTRLSLYDSKFYEEPHTKLQFGAFARGTIPISYQSQFQTLMTSLGGGVSVKKNLYRFNLQIQLAASKSFDRQTSAGFPCSASQVSPLAVVPGEAPDVNATDVLLGFQNGDCRSGDVSQATVVNTDWALVPSASIAYNFTDKLSVAVAFSYIRNFQYAVPVDQLSSTVVSSSGPVVTGQQSGDSLWGITSVNYNIDEHWGLSAGIWNVGVPQTAYGHQYRNPFLDTLALNSNDWNLFFDVSASF